METATKCMMCDISLECGLTRDARDLCKSPHKISYGHIALLKSNLYSRLRVLTRERKLYSGGH